MKIVLRLVEISRFSFIWHTGVLKRIGISQFCFSMLIGNHFCTSCENLVRFGLVKRSFRQKNLYGRSRELVPRLVHVRYGVGLLGIQVISK